MLVIQSVLMIHRNYCHPRVVSWCLMKCRIRSFNFHHFKIGFFNFYIFSDFLLVLYILKIWVLSILCVLQYHQNDWHPKVSYGPLNHRNYREFEISKKVQKRHTLIFRHFVANIHFLQDVIFTKMQQPYFLMQREEF